MIRALIALLVVAALALGAWLVEAYSFESRGPALKETTVLIKPGSGVSSIAQSLRRAKVISSPDLFVLGVRMRGLQGKMKAGEYAIPARASMQHVAEILVSGKSIEHKLTIAEGLTSQMAYDLVKKDKVLTGAPGAVPAEGTILPETYLFLRGTTRAELLLRMQKSQTQLLDKLWPKRAKDLPFKTREEALVLASVVEKETGVASERPRIASVFVNRLRQGIRLQSDPTIIYGLTKGYPLGRGIRLSELNRVTPYNTYAIDGLPPTPIANPGRDSIRAVLNPPKTTDLFFVADGTGGHVFTGSLGEHNANVAKWRVIEKQMPPNQRVPQKPEKPADPAIRKSNPN